MNEEEKIKEEINALIESFYENGEVKKEIERKFKYEAVKWNDLRCYNVKKCYVAYIGEVDPNCERFKEFIKESINKKATEIEIITKGNEIERALFSPTVRNVEILGCNWNVLVYEDNTPEKCRWVSEDLFNRALKEISELKQKLKRKMNKIRRRK